MIQHPQVQYPKEKESHWLMDKCGRDVPSCAPEAQQQYVVEVRMMAAAHTRLTG